ncbi:hypothetical protein ARAM_002980 [Aspergillus rambellii]|uniref:Terpenoid synthase n=1 Tax=Aspergillus rambellii TaxID=308745 RepID=A0A0F8UEW7_9EURO|nr:hypothetical protein ARAM_002980 [Aspergillus rambellii]
MSPTNTKSDLFPFLKPESTGERCLLQHANPSKYWTEAEQAAADYARLVSKDRIQDVAYRKYLDTVVDTAAHFATNLTPAGNLTRAKILAKAYVLIFMHDDAVDSGNYSATIPNADQGSLATESSYLGYNIVTRELLTEDDGMQGPRVLEGLLPWGSTVQKSPPERFETLGEYMTYRAEDSGAYLVFRTMEFSCGVHLPDHDSSLLRHLRTLCAKHFLLSNDLYSHKKEVLAEAKNGGPLLNAVRTVQELMSTSASSAKVILRQVIHDIERQMNEAHGRLEESESVTESQLLYAQGLIVLTAGNMFFSATCFRYAYVFDGSRLADA